MLANGNDGFVVLKSDSPSVHEAKDSQAVATKMMSIAKTTIKELSTDVKDLTTMHTEAKASIKDMQMKILVVKDHVKKAMNVETNLKSALDMESA